VLEKAHVTNALSNAISRLIHPGNSRFHPVCILHLMKRWVLLVDIIERNMRVIALFEFATLKTDSGPPIPRSPGPIVCCQKKRLGLLAIFALTRKFRALRSGPLRKDFPIARVPEHVGVFSSHTRGLLA